MNQMKVGNYIALKRKEKNLTQEQLAERLGISNKTVSKWECGRHMPDYALIEQLCEELDVSISELICGRDIIEDERKSNENNILELSKELDILSLEHVVHGGRMVVLTAMLIYLMGTQTSVVALTIIANIVATIFVVTAVYGIIRCEMLIKKIKK